MYVYVNCFFIFYSLTENRNLGIYNILEIKILNRKNIYLYKNKNKMYSTQSSQLQMKSTKNRTP